MAYDPAMVHFRAQELIEELHQGTHKAESLRKIRNAVIGNKAKKKMYAQALPALLDLLKDKACPQDQLVHVVTVIGSLGEHALAFQPGSQAASSHSCPPTAPATASTTADAVPVGGHQQPGRAAISCPQQHAPPGGVSMEWESAPPAVSALVEALQHPSPEVVEAAVRSLKQLCSSAAGDLDPSVQRFLLHGTTPGHLVNLVNSGVAAVTATSAAGANNNCHNPGRAEPCGAVGSSDGGATSNVGTPSNGHSVQGGAAGQQQHHHHQQGELKGAALTSSPHHQHYDRQQALRALAAAEAAVVLIGACASNLHNRLRLAQAGATRAVADLVATQAPLAQSAAVTALAQMLAECVTAAQSVLCSAQHPQQAVRSVQSAPGTVHTSTATGRTSGSSSNRCLEALIALLRSPTASIRLAAASCVTDLAHPASQPLNSPAAQPTTLPPQPVEADPLQTSAAATESQSQTELQQEGAEEAPAAMAVDGSDGEEPAKVTIKVGADFAPPFAAVAAAATAAKAKAAGISHHPAVVPSRSLQQWARALSGAGHASHAVAAPDNMSLQGRLEEARHLALPVLIKLMSDTTTCQGVPPVLARLLHDSEKLQAAAADADAVRLLALLLARMPDPGSEPGRAVEGCLQCLAWLCMRRDGARQQLVEAKVLKSIIVALSHKEERVRAAGAACIMALSRSVKTLRGDVLGTEVAEALVRLLSDESTQVQVTAAAALCNLVLEFSSGKEAVLKLGGVTRLAALADSHCPSLRLHACWALRNMAFMADTPVRAAIRQSLPWATMRRLLGEGVECESESGIEHGIQEQALCILRNLCMDGPHHIQAVFEWGGDDVLAALEQLLDPARSSSATLLSHALYTIVNILTGDESHKERVMGSNIPALLIHHLHTGTATEVRLPAVWSIINLSWPEQGPPGGSPAGGGRRRSSTSPSPMRGIQAGTSGGSGRNSRGRAPLFRRSGSGGGGGGMRGVAGEREEREGSQSLSGPGGEIRGPTAGWLSIAGRERVVDVMRLLGMEAAAAAALAGTAGMPPSLSEAAAGYVPLSLSLTQAILGQQGGAGTSTGAGTGRGSGTPPRAGASVPAEQQAPTGAALSGRAAQAADVQAQQAVQIGQAVHFGQAVQLGGSQVVPNAGVAPGASQAGTSAALQATPPAAAQGGEGSEHSRGPGGFEVAPSGPQGQLTEQPGEGNGDRLTAVPSGGLAVVQGSDVATVEGVVVEPGTGVAGRVRRLVALGVVEALRSMQVGRSLDLRERVRTALEQLGAA